MRYVPPGGRTEIRQAGGVSHRVAGKKNNCAPPRALESRPAQGSAAPAGANVRLGRDPVADATVERLQHAERTGSFHEDVSAAAEWQLHYRRSPSTSSLNFCRSASVSGSAKGVSSVAMAFVLLDKTDFTWPFIPDSPCHGPFGSASRVCRPPVDFLKRKIAQHWG